MGLPGTGGLVYTAEVRPPYILGGPMIDPDHSRRLRQAAAKAREWTETRDHLIVEAVAAGGSLREVAETVGLSHTAVAKIARKANP